MLSSLVHKYRISVSLRRVPTSSDLRYSRSMRSASNGTRGRSRRAALMSAQRPCFVRWWPSGQLQALSGAGDSWGARLRRYPLTVLAGGAHRALCNAEATVLPTCLTSSRRARRTNPSTSLRCYAHRPRCTFTTPRMQSTHIFASHSDKRIDDESGL